MKKSLFWIIATLGLTLIVVGGGVGMYIYQSNQKPIKAIPANIHSTDNYKVYYPSKLPKGCRLDKTSFSQTNDALVYVAKCGQDTISFSMQAKPQNISITDLNIRLMKEPSDTVVNIGQAVIGTLDNKTTASILADKTWILIRDNGDQNKLQIEDIAKSLVALDK